MSVSEEMANYRAEYYAEHGKYPQSITLHVNRYVDLKSECDKVMQYIRDDVKNKRLITFMGMRVDVVLEE